MTVIQVMPAIGFGKKQSRAKLQQQREKRKAIFLDNVTTKHGVEIANQLAGLTRRQMARTLRELMGNNTPVQKPKRGKSREVKRQEKLEKLVQLIGPDKALEYKTASSEVLNRQIKKAESLKSQMERRAKKAAFIQPNIETDPHYRRQVLFKTIRTLKQSAKGLLDDRKVFAILDKLFQTDCFGDKNPNKHTAEIQKMLALDAMHGGNLPVVTNFLAEKKHLVESVKQQRATKLKKTQAVRFEKFRDTLQYLASHFTQDEIHDEIRRQCPNIKGLLKYMPISGKDKAFDDKQAFLRISFNPNENRELLNRLRDWGLAVGKFFHKDYIAFVRGLFKADPLQPVKKGEQEPHEALMRFFVEDQMQINPELHPGLGKFLRKKPSIKTLIELLQELKNRGQLKLKKPEEKHGFELLIDYLKLEQNKKTPLQTRTSEPSIKEQNRFIGVTLEDVLI